MSTTPSIILIFGLLLTGSAVKASDEAKSKPQFQDTFYEISGLVQNFFLHDKDSLAKWEDFSTRLQPQLFKLDDRVIFASHVNQGLEALGLGSNALIHELQQEYWLQTKPHQDVNVTYFGAWFERRGKRWYVREVFPGSPAQSAGLMRGDEILSLDGQEFNPIMITRHDTERRRFKLEWRRDPLSSPRVDEVQVEAVDFAKAYSQLINTSASLERHGRKQIAYLRLPAMRSDFLPSFRSHLEKNWPKADALVLDLRDGHPGRDSGFIPLFFPELEEGKLPEPKTPIWVLVNRHTKEGLEWLAFLLREQFGAVLVGEPTAGQSFQTEDVWLKSSQFLLRLARPDPGHIASGLQNGQPLPVDLPVRSTLIFAHGQDEVLEQALKQAAKMRQQPGGT